MSIVIIIIGLIVGGILVGLDLVHTAEVRAEVSQMTKYQTAVHTFQQKYGGYLPGDIPDPYASQFGFQARGQYAGEGDGNGILQGVSENIAGHTFSNMEQTGESPVFWVDLSTAGLIDGSFSTASTYSTPGTTITLTSSPNLSAYFPQAKIGQGNYIYVYSGGWQYDYSSFGDSQNYFGLSAITSLGNSITSSPGLTVQQTYNIDNKIDDGMPQSGKVMAIYLNSTGVWWAAGGGVEGANISQKPTNKATSASSTTCYDNGSGSGAQQYSIEQNGGTGMNCALSFQFQ